MDYKLDLKTIENTPHLLDILLQVEDILDSLDIYVFKHWFNGEVVQGPKIRKFWVTVSLKYDYEEMPDPRAALRLLKHGIYVKYNKVPVEKLKTDDAHFCWVLDVDIPRKLLGGMNNSGVDFYDQSIDADDVNSSVDDGVNSDTAYHTADDGIDATQSDVDDGAGGGNE